MNEKYYVNKVDVDSGEVLEWNIFRLLSDALLYLFKQSQSHLKSGFEFTIGMGEEGDNHFPPTNG